MVRGLSETKETIAYLLKRTGCIHPFRMSRILAYAELLALNDSGIRLTNLTYKYAVGVFYIEGIKEMIKQDECFVKHEGDPEKGIKGCIEYENFY
jgi:hydroxypyruvate isomerase